MAIDKELMDAYFLHGIDITNRRVFLSDIDSESVDKVVKGLYLMETDSPTEPVELFICSYGGSVEHTLALHDIIRTLRIPVRTFAYGVCMSAAPLLLASGQRGERWISPNLQLMFHALSDEISGKLSDMKSALKYSADLDDLWLDLLVSYSTKDKKFWNTKINKNVDWYFGSQEAIEFGLADNIWEESQ